jgi:conjugal transfer pilus assembly protein TraV
MKRRTLLALLVSVVFSGCANWTGLDATNKFACKAPDGVSCMSVSGIYYNAIGNNLPGQRHPHEGPATDGDAAAGAKAGKAATTVRITPAARATPSSFPFDPAEANSAEWPIISPPEIMRIWFAPVRDADNDMHDQAYVYIVLNKGDWQMDYVRSIVQRANAPLRAPRSAKGADAVAPAAPAGGGTEVTGTGLMQRFKPSIAPVNTASQAREDLKADMESARDVQ